MNQETSPIPSGKVTYPFEDGRTTTLPLTETVLLAWRKGFEMREAKQDQYAFLEWFAGHVLAVSKTAISLDEADGLFTKMEEDYLQKKAKPTPSPSPPTSPASTTSTPSA